VCVCVCVCVCARARAEVFVCMCMCVCLQKMAVKAKPLFESKRQPVLYYKVKP
jgi:hypothetical protein